MPNRPRIIQVVNSASEERGGAERMVRLLHKKFLARGRDAWVVALEDEQDNSLENHIGLCLTSPYRLAAMLKLRKVLNHLAKRPSVLHAHLFPSGAYTSTLKRLGLLKLPLIYTEHSTKNRRRKGGFVQRLDGLAYDGYDRVICISDGVKDELLSAQPHAAKISEVIPNGIELPETVDQPKYLDRERVIVSACRLNEVKNLDTAIRAFATMDDKTIRYKILGDGPELSNLKQLAENLDISNRIDFEGFRKDALEFFRHSRVLLIPSHWEGFGLAAVEAMSCGLPVIASNVPGLSEVVGDDESCGILVNQSSPQCIADALDRVFQKPHEAEKMSESAARRALAFNIDATVRAHEDLYNALSTA